MAIGGLIIEWLLIGYVVAIKGLLSGYCEDFVILGKIDGKVN